MTLWTKCVDSTKTPP